MTAKTSPEGVRRIDQREGEKLKAYRDSRGFWTIGVGHLTNAFFRVFPGLTISKEKSLELLAHDLGAVEATINAVVRRPITQYQFDALASFGFNIGVGGLAHSSVVRLINEGRMADAANAFMDWVKPEEIRSRRDSERRQFLGA